MYKLTLTGTIIDLSTGASIPVAPGNTDYQAYLAWIAAGGTPDPPDAAPLKYNTNIRLDARVQTTTATPTEIYRITLALNTGYFGELRCFGVDFPGNGNIKVRSARVLAKRLGAGAILVGTSPPEDIQDAGASTWVVGASVSGNDFIITVTGAAGRTIQWSLTGQVTSFTPAGL